MLVPVLVLVLVLVGGVSGIAGFFVVPVLGGIAGYVGSWPDAVIRGQTADRRRWRS
ncbi:hypothetical protein ACWC0A_32795 [Streptomyces scopuliridis]